MNPTNLSFTLAARVLHWTMAVLILAMLFIGVGMVATVSAKYPVLLAIHKPLGIAILGAASQAAFAHCADVPPDHIELHQRMHAAMLACLGHELFQGTGQPISPWQARLMALTDDTQALLHEWLNDSSGHADPHSRGMTPRDR